MRIHGKEITTIVSDLDGTLLGKKKEPDPALFPVIKELKKRGVSFVAASGRQYNNMRLILEPILDETPFICENGSLIVKNEETVYIKYIPKELSFELLDDMLAVPGTETIVSCERSLYTLENRTDFIRYMNEFLKPDVNTVKDYRQIAGGFNKISIWWKDGECVASTSSERNTRPGAIMRIGRCPFSISCTCVEEVWVRSRISPVM